MKILLALNKTLNRDSVNRLDSGYYNIYIPLLELGHQVYFYDTIDPTEKNFQKVVDKFKPDLIFCCLTGNRNIAPYEPSFEEISEITKKGNIITFNWFCDDTWRFDNFSQIVCNSFTVCSTPELDYINKYKEIGYDNIILGQWHCNENLYLSNNYRHKIGFCGGITKSRINFFNSIKESVSYLQSCSYEDLIQHYSSSRMVINPTTNDNDPEKKSQMKLRIFEATCANSMLLTQNVKNIDHYFYPGKEIVVFDDIADCNDKLYYYSYAETSVAEIARKGRERFLREHTSKIRLEKILHEIKKIC